MKKLSLILLAVLVIILGGCTSKDNKSNSSNSENLPFETSNNVVMNIYAMMLEDDVPHISLSIKNNSDQNDVVMGQDFYILDGDKAIEPKGTVTFEQVEFTIKNYESHTISVDLRNYDLKENKTYRLVKNYKFKGNKQIYGAFVDFKIDNSDITGDVMTVTDMVWLHNDNANYNPQDKEYLVGADNILYSKMSLDKPNVIKKWYEICRLEEFEITQKDLQTTANGKWAEGYSEQKLISENKVAFKYVNENSKNSCYLLKQNDGTVFLIDIWSGPQSIYRIAELEKK